MFRNISFFCSLNGMFLKVFHSCVYVFECRFVGRAKLRKLSEQGKATLNEKSKQASPYASKPLWNNSCLYSAGGKPQDWEHLTHGLS